MTAEPPPGCRRNAPYVVDCAAGKHAWCRCGHSGRYPLCDGAHRQLPAGGDAATTTPLKVTFDAPRRVAWCACGRTGNAPFCDGSHSRA